MSYECFTVDIRDQVAHVTLSRPEAFNSMTRAFWKELPDIVRRIDDAAAARVIVLSSTGKHFTAGMDLSVFTSGPDMAGKEVGRVRASLMQTVLRLQQTFSCLDQARIPVLAAVQGGCIGGGVDMVSACDMRFATRDAFFCIQEINLGMTADVGTFPRLAHVMPQGIVRELAYTGRRFQAEEARACGFVNALFDSQAELLDAVTGIAVDIHQALAAGRVGIEGDAQLRARPFDRRRAPPHRRLADGHVPAHRHAGGLRSEVREARSELRGPASGGRRDLSGARPNEE